MALHQTPSGGGSRPRGFASMDPARQRQIASQGGRAAHQQGTAHEFDSDEARVAGRKGGEAVSRDRAHMSEIGRRGGEASGGGRGRRDASPDGDRGVRAESNVQTVPARQEVQRE